jgi:thioredoxin reductase
METGLIASQVIGCDFLVSATGVAPNTGFLRLSTSGDQGAMRSTEDGYLAVNQRMETSIPDVYAAGDCCTVTLEDEGGEHYFQMRLWTQARSMGTYAAQTLCGRAEEFGMDAQFDLFAHITRFFGYKVSCSVCFSS